jgi:Carboxypeptidase regulatory-like domain
VDLATPFVPAVALPDAAPVATPAQAPTPSRGDQTLSGRLIALDGAGLSRLRVELLSGETVVAATESGSDGTYTLSGLAKGRYRLRVSGAGVVPAAIESVTAPARNIGVVVSRRVALAGRVVGGAPGPAVLEIASTSLAEPRRLSTAPDGSFALADLPEGRYRLSARRGSDAGELSDVARFGPGPFVPVEVRIGPASVVRGRVVSGEGGVAGAWLVLEPAEDEVTPRRARTDGTGAFRFDGVVPGSWTLDVEAAGVSLPARLPVDARAARETELTVTLVPATSIAGEIVDLAGQPIDGAEISLVGDDGTWSAATRARRRAWLEGRALGRSGKLIPAGELGVVLGPVPYPPPPGATQALLAERDASAPGERFASDASGRFVLTSVRPGQWRVRARHPDFAPGEAEVPAYGPARLVLRRGATLVGTVSDATGPRFGVRIAAGDEVVFSDEAGRFRLAHVLGDVTLRATPRGEPPVSRLVVVSDADEGKVLETSIVLGTPVASESGPVAAATTGDLELEVRDASTFGAIGDFAVELRGPGPTVRRRGKSGVMTVRELATGTWKLSVTARGFARREEPLVIAAAPPTRVRVELVQGATVGGTVYDEHGDAVAGAEVSCGGVSARTSGTGSFRLTGVPPGEAAVVASHDTRGRGETRVPLRGGDEVLTVEVRIGR